MNHANWWAGRFWWISVAALLVTFVLLYMFWWQVADGPWSPPNEPRYAQMMEVAPIIGGIIALYGILPKFDWIDQQSPKPIRIYDTAAALIVIVVFALLTTLVRWLWSLSDFYTRFLPMDMVIKNPAMLDEAVPYAAVFAFSANVAAVLGLACLTTALIGRTLGPTSGIVWFALLLIAQGHLKLQLLVVPGYGIPTLETGDTFLVGAILAVSLIAYYLTAAGTRPLIHRLSP